MQQCQGSSDDWVTSTSKPARLIAWQLFHVTAECFNEERLRHS